MFLKQSDFFLQTLSLSSLCLVYTLSNTGENAKWYNYYYKPTIKFWIKQYLLFVQRAGSEFKNVK